MSKESRKFKVPDELANVYDFANTLDLRRFLQYGVEHPQGDELAGPKQLADWMQERGLDTGAGRVTLPMFETALRLREALRAYLQCEPAERRRNEDVLGALDDALAPFPLRVEARAGRGAILSAAREDALAGLSAIAVELHDATLMGTLDRLKMCASEECRRVFFDRSKPSTRRWCMSTLCGNRMKTRAYRERQRQAR
ncbi:MULTISPECIES: CGNR zinc finger domain-containing protein [unclassified Bradyrhizobium]|uniref:CGNR zinc finger domain-containing protein n=1 Tax=unclassified Bradyrhizobium TaxID=2631580 RepID=UPI001FF7E06E|nr:MULTISPECIES: CGNR zinc finger domain-containing protein [unclassified Bradyrhizobium]MCK1709984.1 CGNR zinc finger domain-containing protein [Bradyrhizobium sp. 143]MCK1725925.1 CGNR zinc finger domain-containing protein [Bradyrhizobium sp. 142]